MPHSERIAEAILNSDACSFSVSKPFVGSGGFKYPLYLDLRRAYAYPAVRKLVVEALVHRIKSLQVPPDVIAGAGTPAIGWAALVAEHLGLPFVYVRSRPKEQGMERSVEGFLPPGKDVVIIADVIALSVSAVAAIETLRQEGQANIGDAVCIYSHGFLSTLEKMEEASVRLHSLTDLAMLLRMGKEHDLLSDADSAEIVSFARDPEAWTKRK